MDCGQLDPVRWSRKIGMKHGDKRGAASDMRAPSAGQEAVLAFLASGAAFPGGGPVTRVETHGAYVFLN
jgi:hypothetical protein